MRPCAAALALLALTGCALPPSCPPGTVQATLTETWFGRSIGGGGGEVSETDWARFLAEEVTPRYPDGLTVLDAVGQWRGRDGAILRERSKKLEILLPGTDASTARTRMLPIETAWKARFKQESVLTAYSRRCISF
jgi:hypothetical protein